MLILIYGKHDFHKAMFEFAYELMKRYNPDVLEIPLVGDGNPSASNPNILFCERIEDDAFD